MTNTKTELNGDHTEPNTNNMKKHLTFLLEEDITDIHTLVTYSHHPSPLVREGAVYGLEKNTNPLHDRVYHMMLYDESPGVRTAALEAIEEHEND